MKCTILLLSTAAAMLTGCAASTTSSHAYGPPPIPEGMGRLILQPGSINQLNYYVVDESTGEEVHEDMPRTSSYSPSGYDTGAEMNNLWVDLPPGTYQIVVNTDIKDDVEVDGAVLTMGQETHVPIRVGRFQIVFVAASEFGAQMPFLIMDYNMRTVLGRGMTSREIRRFIVPEGRYKIRMENSPSGFDEQRPIEVTYGRITQVRIGTQEQPVEEQGTPAN